MNNKAHEEWELIEIEEEEGIVGNEGGDTPMKLKEEYSNQSQWEMDDDNDNDSKKMKEEVFDRDCQNGMPSASTSIHCHHKDIYIFGNPVTDNKIGKLANQCKYDTQRQGPALKRFSEHRIKTGSPSQFKGYQHKDDVIASGQIILPHHSSSSLSKQQQRKIIEDLTTAGNKSIKFTHVFFFIIIQKINSLFFIAYSLFFIQKKKKKGQNQKIA
ncbi:hypothetical protein RFI_21943 [Reticulomyxa filosa]|uniref:Uncharacterized protein n=1 Tax=Reticulomyxa filosa TaxID=46433 RepID=X6MPT8_RETFI|nr:hypothetical protein RFI_21943 [Reticulomyxa filosa]|eukprot:ETO15422.1 hypothetical protein RFI_21943 [Reticulomyxa filosa]